MLEKVRACSHLFLLLPCMLKNDKRTINAWAIYDWANSSYPLVISTAIFPIFYETITNTEHTGIADNQVHFFGWEVTNTALVSYVNAVAFLIVSFMSPILSGMADYIGNKKSFLRFFCYLGSAATMSLYFFNIDHLELGMLTLMLAAIGYWSSIVFYNSFLPMIADAEQHDRISAKGFALGYFGSSLLLIVCLIAMMKFGMPAKYAFVLTGIWWFGFSHLTYRKLPNVKTGNKVHRDVMLKGLRELKGVWRSMTHNKRLKRYLQAFFVYSMGVQTVMLMAVYFGTKEISWSSEEEKQGGLIISVLIIQFIAIGGAYLLSGISSRYGNIKALMVALFLWVLICISALWVTTPTHFYIIAGCVGLVMGGIQSLSRSTYAKLLPETNDTASYFSFFDVSEKIGIVIGIFAYGFIEDLTGSMRNSIVALIVFFVIGFILLLRVPTRDAES